MCNLPLCVVDSQETGVQGSVSGVLFTQYTFLTRRNVPPPLPGSFLSSSPRKGDLDEAPIKLPSLKPLLARHKWLP